MEPNHSIAAVVVTYNRAAMLLDCLKSITSQTLLPDELFIVDNRSTDNTQELLRQQEYVAGTVSEQAEYGDIYRTDLAVGDRTMAVTYILKNDNDGGAGGFSAGMTRAFETGYGWIWMMDDDGVAEPTELAELLDKCMKHGIAYANPLVIDMKDHSRLSFGLEKTKLVAPFLDREILLGDLNPFNGTFVRRDVIERIGVVKREMFIWGDELEYTFRTKKAGFRIGTVCTARHYHPAQKATTVHMIPFTSWIKMPLPPPARSWIYYRNRGYINRNYRPLKIRVGWLGVYTILLGTRFKLKELGKLYKYYFRGMRNDYRNDR